MIRLKLKRWFQWNAHISAWNAWNTCISLWNTQNSWFPLKSWELVTEDYRRRSTKYAHFKLKCVIERSLLGMVILIYCLIALSSVRFNFVLPLVLLWVLKPVDLIVSDLRYPVIFVIIFGNLATHLSYLIIDQEWNYEIISITSSTSRFARIPNSH